MHERRFDLRRVDVDLDHDEVLHRRQRAKRACNDIHMREVLRRTRLAPVTTSLRMQICDTC